MQAIKIHNETRNIGKPVDWNDEIDGECGSLSVRDIQKNGHNIMVSRWEFDDDDRAKIADGECIYLYIYSDRHPVVGFSIDD